jgi:hypothetical protein
MILFGHLKMATGGLGYGGARSPSVNLKQGLHAGLA